MGQSDMSANLWPRQTSQDQLLKLIANPFEAAFQVNAFWASLGVSVGFTILLALLFSFVRPRHNLVYAPKTKHADEKHAPPPMGKGLFEWFGPVIKTKEPVLVDKIGLDAVVFLRFTRMLRNIFLCLGLVGLVIMIPVNILTGDSSIEDRSDAFAVMTPLYVFGNGLWAQVVIAWVFDIIVVYFLWHNYGRIRQLRRAYFGSPEYQMSLHARTVVVRDIPQSMRSEEGLLRITGEVNPNGVLPWTAIGHNVRILPTLIEEHDETVKKLESVLAKYLKNPNSLPPRRPTMRPPRKHHGDRPDAQVDAIEYLTNRIGELEREIKDVRERVDKRDVTPYGFASWEQIEQAHAVAYASRKKSPQGTIIQMAPRPTEIIWNNLSLPRAARKSKVWLNAVSVTILTAVWTPINAAIAIFLSNLSNLGSVWPSFQTQLEAHPKGWAFVQGILSPGITSLVYLVLPIIFRRLQIRAGDVSKPARERHVLRNLHLFFVLNNLVIFSLFSAMWQFISLVVKANHSTGNVWEAIKEGQFFLTVTTSLCQISPFWITWILQRNLGAAVDLAQLWQLTYVWFCRTFMAPTPRQNIEWTAPPPFDYSTYYNYFLFYSTVALSFSTLQPLVLVVTALYFSIDSVLKKYLLMYVFITKNESGGTIWKTLFNRIVFGLGLANVIIAVVVKARGTWSMVIAIAPLLVGLVGFKYYCARTFDDDIMYYVRSTATNDAERLGPASAHPQRLDRMHAKFGHPALYKPLMTPMVHAKARHILPTLYHGRLSVDVDAQSLAFSDSINIPLEPVGADGQRKKSEAPFELVSDAQQDFSFYKNRADFREDGGGIYGKPEDLVSERSRTPKSFLGGLDAYESGPSSPSGVHRREYSDESNKPSGGILRKAVPSQAHSAFRDSPGSGTHTRDSSADRLGQTPDADIGLRQGPYTDPFDDRTNLLRSATDLNTPSGDFMSLDRWRTGGSSRGYHNIGEGPTPGDQDAPGSYDYFRRGGSQRP